MKCNQIVTMQYMPTKFVGLDATCVTNQTCDNENFGFKEGTCEKLVVSNVNNLQGFTFFFLSRIQSYHPHINCKIGKVPHIQQGAILEGNRSHKMHGAQIINLFLLQTCYVVHFSRFN
jgi:hypothetical protein